MKPWAYAAIVIALIAAIGAVYAKGHSAGYNKRDREVQAQIIKVQEQTRFEEELRWASAVTAALDQVKTEVKIVEKINVVEKQVPKIVERVRIERPECTDYFGNSYAGLLNDQVRAANSLPNTEPAASVAD